MSGGLSDPMEEGKLAASQGDPESSNPYESGSAESEEWLEGYRYSASHDDDDEPVDD